MSAIGLLIFATLLNGFQQAESVHYHFHISKSKSSKTKTSFSKDLPSVVTEKKKSVFNDSGLNDSKISQDTTDTDTDTDTTDTHWPKYSDLPSYDVPKIRFNPSTKTQRTTSFYPYSCENCSREGAFCLVNTSQNYSGCLQNRNRNYNDCLRQCLFGSCELGCQLASQQATFYCAETYRGTIENCKQQKEVCSNNCRSSSELKPVF